MSAQADLFPGPATVTVADLADFIARETCYAVLYEQIAPESLVTPGAAGFTVRKLVASLRPDQTRDWLVRSEIKPQRARRQWVPQLAAVVQREVDRCVERIIAGPSA